MAQQSIVRKIHTPDGVSIQVRESGNSSGPPIVFVHGFGQCSLAWTKQTASVLAERFRLIAYDLRGHGDSDKPHEREFYQEGARWGDELKAVLDQCAAHRPVVVAWSFGGGVVGEYLKLHGHDDLAAINFVAASTVSDPAHVGPARKAAAAMFTDDLAQNIAAVRSFVRGCFAREPAPEEFETILAYNMVVPAAVRALITGRDVDCEAALERLDIPVLITHGTADRITFPTLSEYTKSKVKRSRLSLYEGIGHSPFWENAPRFNRELGALADEVFAADRMDRD
jgi:pimeloyl-ACP methyl ester carboxylesterase